MLVSLRTEFMKIRRLRLGLVASAVGIALAGMIWAILQAALTRLAHETHIETPWQNGVIGDATVLVVLALPTLVILITALIFFVEHRNNMWKQLGVLPPSVSSIYAAKFIVVQGVIVLGILAFLVAALLMWILRPDEIRSALPVPDAEVRRTLSALALRLYCSLLPVSLFQFLLSARLSNILHPVGIGLGLTIACLLLSGPDNARWFPYAYPGAVVISEFTGQPDENAGTAQATDVDYHAPAGAFSGAPDGAIILVDEAHQNRHALGTIENPGTLWWIIAPAKEAGIAVHNSYALIRSDALSKVDVLVIGGVPADEKRRRGFSEEEVDVVARWVKQGGSLLLLTDHPPFGESVLPLARALGVEFTLDVVSDSSMCDAREPASARLVFTKSQGLVGEHEITKGIQRVITYGGQGVWHTGRDATVLLRFSQTAQTSDGKAVLQPVHGSPVGQLLAFQFGQGRVVVSGESGLFAAQRKVDGSQIGVGDREADNGRLAINVFRWLLHK